MTIRVKFKIEIFFEKPNQQINAQDFAAQELGHGSHVGSANLRFI